MNELDLFESEAIKSVAKSGDYRILVVEGKAALAEKFSSPPQVAVSTSTSADKSILIGAIVLFSLGVFSGVAYQSNADARKIQDLQAENLVLESKISKIRDLVK